MNNTSRTGRLSAPDREPSRLPAATETQTTHLFLRRSTAVEGAASQDVSRSARGLAGPERQFEDTRSTFRAFTFVELLVVVAVLAFCAATLLPALARTKAPAQRIYCANNLKGIGEAFHIWGQENADAFPMRVPVKNGGYSDFIGIRVVSVVQVNARGVSGIFSCLSNELSTPKALICPAENEHRLPATTFDGNIPVGTSGIPLTNDLNVSYFVGVDAAQTNPRAFLAGDHNLGSDGNITPNRGFVAVLPSSYSPDFKVSLGTSFVTNGGVGWLNTMHSNQGNVGLADGSVSLYNRVQLQIALRNTGVSHGIIASPAFPNPSGCSGPGANRIQFP